MRAAVEEGLEWLDVVERRGLGHVTPVEQYMDAHALDALGLRAPDHRLQVVDVAMHVAIREQAQEVQRASRAVIALHRGDDLLPRLAFPDRAGCDRVGDQRRTLRIDLPRADRVVADLGIAHVLVRRHADRRTMRAQRDVRAACEERVERRLARSGDRAAGVRLRQAVTVHDDDDDGAGNAGEIGESLQHGKFLVRSGVEKRALR
jgi:hypothetical protein